MKKQQQQQQKRRLLCERHTRARRHLFRPLEQCTSLGAPPTRSAAVAAIAATDADAAAAAVATGAVLQHRFCMPCGSRSPAIVVATGEVSVGNGKIGSELDRRVVALHRIPDQPSLLGQHFLGGKLGKTGT